MVAKLQGVSLVGKAPKRGKPKKQWPEEQRPTGNLGWKLQRGTLRLQTQSLLQPLGKLWRLSTCLGVAEKCKI